MLLPSQTRQRQRIKRYVGDYSHLISDLSQREESDGDTNALVTQTSPREGGACKEHSAGRQRREITGDRGNRIENVAEERVRQVRKKGSR